MDIAEFISTRDRFAAHCGIELLEVGAGYARAEMQIEEHHMNGANTVHGGAIFTLADLVFAAASNSHGTLALAINVSISYLKAALKGKLTAEGEEVSRHRRLASYTIRVTDEEGDLVALFQGMVYRKKERLEELLEGIG